MNWISDPNIWVALLTLSALEIVLGIDNIIFIAILSGKLPQHQQAKARATGLMVAMISRIALLFSITLIMRLTQPLFTILNFGSKFFAVDRRLACGRRARTAHSQGLYLFCHGLLDLCRSFKHENSPASAPTRQVEKSTIGKACLIESSCSRS